MSRIVKISKKEYDGLKAQHAAASSEFYSNSIHVHRPKGENCLARQTYSHASHGIPTIEVRTHESESGAKTTYHRYDK